MKVYLMLLVLISWFEIEAQNTKQIILDNTIQIHSIDPSDENMDELKFLKSSIGDKRIVMLGEQDHGDAPTFMAKTRIVKFLHEEMDFDVIAFESDFYGIQDAWNNIEAVGLDTLYSTIYPMWTGCVQCQGLFNYIKQELDSDNPITVAGIDSRHVMVNWARPKRNQNELSSIIKQLGAKVSKHDSCERFIAIHDEVLRLEFRSKADSVDKALFYSFLDIIRNELEKSALKDKVFWLQELRNTEGHARSGWEKGMHENDFREIRDEQMADNLLWLFNTRYPDKKIIVWAANTHIVKNGYKPTPKVEFVNGMYTENGYFNTVTLGGIINDTISEQMFNLGFTSYQGKAGRITVPGKIEISPPTENSYESWINEYGFDYAYTDMIKVDAERPNWFYSKLFGHKDMIKKNWSNMYDGVFYIKNMYPCKPK